LGVVDDLVKAAVSEIRLKDLAAHFLRELQAFGYVNLRLLCWDPSDGKRMPRPRLISPNRI
jgi:hypothetical protein